MTNRNATTGIIASEFCRISTEVMLRSLKLFPAICVMAVAVLAQRTPQQIQQRQQNLERDLQRDQANREAQTHQAQVEQMRQIDRQQAEQQRQQTEQQLKAQAVAAQEQLYQLQQAEQQNKTQQQQAQDQNLAPNSAAAADQSQQQLQQPAVQHWSWKNMTTADKIGLAALGVLLAALAFAAGIIPTRLLHRTE
jgi:hypothetical protein